MYVMKRRYYVVGVLIIPSIGLLTCEQSAYLPSSEQSQAEHACGENELDSIPPIVVNIIHRNFIIYIYTLELFKLEVYCNFYQCCMCNALATDFDCL